MNMSMNTHKAIVAVLFWTVLCVACNDLDLNESQYHTKKYQFSDFGQVKEVMTNVYGYLLSGFYDFQACASDDAVYANYPDICRSYYDGSWSANKVVDDMWGHYYRGIRAANYLLDNCPEDFEIARWNENYKYFLEQLKNYPWEAKALRAFFHFELLKRYRRIVLADMSYLPEQVNRLIPADYGEAVKWIDEELSECARHLPASYANTYYSEIGRVTWGFALAARSRLLLYAASPLNNPAHDRSKYAKAASAAREFMIRNDKSNNFALGKESFHVENKDLIFGIREAASNRYEFSNFPVGYENGASGTCPSLNLIEAFDMRDGTPFNFDAHKEALLNSAQRDPRMAVAILSNGDIFKGEAIETFIGGRNAIPQENASPTSFYLRKFIQEATSLTAGNVTNLAHIYPLFRCSEVYLNYSEALFEATGNSEFTGVLDGTTYTMSPRAALNAIRKVYGMPDIPAGLSSEAFRIRLHNERRVELCFEGHRFWDIRRWKIGDKTKDIYGITITKHEDESLSLEKKLVQSRYWNDKMYYYPISEQELHKNLNLIQNEGWEN